MFEDVTDFIRQVREYTIAKAASSGDAWWQRRAAEAILSQDRKVWASSKEALYMRESFAKDPEAFAIREYLGADPKNKSGKQ